MKITNSLNRFLHETNATLPIIKYIIETKHKYLLIYNEEHQSYIIIDKDNYDHLELQGHIYYLYTKKPILINGNQPIQIFEIDLLNHDDLLGFNNRHELQIYCEHLPTNTSVKLTSKLIFSPQLANFLLDRGFHIIHLKQHALTGDTIFVFSVEPGFYDSIYDFRQNKLDQVIK